MLTTKEEKTIQESMNFQYKLYITIRHTNVEKECYIMVNSQSCA